MVRPIAGDNYTIILNVGRVGGTWVTRSLGKHPDVFDGCECNFFVGDPSLPEAMDLGRYNIMRLMDAWGRAAFDMRNACVVAPAIAAIPPTRIFPVIRSHVETIVDAALDGVGKKMLVDKSPVYMLTHSAMMFIDKALPKARLLHLVRDFRAVYNSYLHVHPDCWLLREGIDGFCDHVENAYEAFDRLTRDVTTFRYEDLSNEPRDGFSKMFDEMDVDCDEGILDDVIDEDSENRNKSPQWKRTLLDDDVEVLVNRLGPLLERFGYS